MPVERDREREREIKSSLVSSKSESVTDGAYE